MQRICVAVASRNRPKMVERALRSLIRLRIPKDSDVTILVVENGCDQLRDMVDRLTGSQPIPIVYRSEPQIGIASARNCALQYALDGLFDALAFIDDDEIASVEWLEEIVEEMRRSKAPLVGGPVRPIFAGVP